MVVPLTLRSLSSTSSGCRKWSSSLPWDPCPAWAVDVGSGRPSYLEVPVQHLEQWGGCRKWSSSLPWDPCPAWAVDVGSGRPSYLEVPVRSLSSMSSGCSGCRKWSSMSSGCRKWSSSLPWGHELSSMSSMSSGCRKWSVHEEHVQEVVVHLTLRSLSSMSSGCRKVVPVQWVLTLRSLSSMRSGCRKWSSSLPWGPVQHEQWM